MIGPAARADLDAYFERIAYTGARALASDPTRCTWRTRRISRLRIRYPLGCDSSPDSLQAKLVAGRRGGYCFEQNCLFARWRRWASR
jgi:N-hydroxyarylamine O-acetyltransferase